MIFISPHFNPVAIHWGSVQVRWYGLAYLIGFLMVWLCARRDDRHDAILGPGDLLDAMTCGLWGVVIGGRLAYVLIYAWPFLGVDWLMPFRIWEGGMSFHGGLLGGVIGLMWYAHRQDKSFLSLTDLMAPYVPIALGLGRLANWVNGELWGRPTGQSWGMIYPWVDHVLRYPSQWIECFLEGFCLFVLVFLYVRKPRALGQPGGVFLLGYAICRFIAECFRSPDQQIGLLSMNLSMGQLLCLPMLFLGLFFLIRPRYANRLPKLFLGGA
jgi:phosphatidylglycerol---prolipoprotein diacylglyceryl transferase